MPPPPTARARPPSLPFTRRRDPLPLSAICLAKVTTGSVVIWSIFHFETMLIAFALPHAAAVQTNGVIVGRTYAAPSSVCVEVGASRNGKQSSTSKTQRVVRSGCHSCDGSI